MDISSLIVYVNGKIDRSATLAAFEQSVDRYIIEDHIENSVIAEAINVVFDRFRTHKFDSVTINMLGLISLVTTHMNATPDNFTTLSKRIKTFIINNSKGSDSMLLITKGKGGGIKRRSDISKT